MGPRLIVFGSGRSRKGVGDVGLLPAQYWLQVTLTFSLVDVPGLPTVTPVIPLNQRLFAFGGPARANPLPPAPGARRMCRNPFQTPPERSAAPPVLGGQCRWLRLVMPP